MVIRCLKITIFQREFEAQQITSDAVGQRNLHADLCMQIVRHAVGDYGMSWHEVQLHVLSELGKSFARKKEKERSQTEKYAEGRKEESTMLW